MRGTLVAALFAGLAAMAFATPASALPSSTSIQLGAPNTGVIHVGRRDRWRHYDRRYRGYSYYRPYYRPYPYYYSRPYAYYGYGGYPYWYGRPGISFGFSF